MTQANHNNLNEKFLDDAATEVIGAHTVEESDAFTIALAQADEPHRQATRDLRVTVARMAGISPYLEPPARLRGAILEATAPKTFKLDEYRRNNDVAPKWLRRSLVASIGFLIFAAWYNASAKTTIDQLTAQNAKMIEAINLAKPQYAQMVQSNQQLTSALGDAQSSLAKAMMANPNASKGLLKDQFGRQLVLVRDPATQQNILIIPDQNIAPGQFAVLRGKGSDGQVREIQVLAVGRPSDGTHLDSPSALTAKQLPLQWAGDMTNAPAANKAGYNPFDF